MKTFTCSDHAEWFVTCESGVVDGTYICCVGINTTLAQQTIWKKIIRHNEKPTTVQIIKEWSKDTLLKTLELLSMSIAEEINDFNSSVESSKFGKVG